MIFRLLSMIFRFLIGFMRFAIDSWANSSIVVGESSLSFFHPAFPIFDLPGRVDIIFRFSGRF